MDGVRRFDSFEFDPKRHVLTRRNRPLRLSASLTKLLVLFLEHPGELISRDAITDCLWEEPQYVDVSNGINTAVKRLKTALGDNSSKPIYIETVVSLGYRFIAAVEKVAEQPAIVVATSREAAHPAAVSTEVEWVRSDASATAGSAPQAFAGGAVRIADTEDRVEGACAPLREAVSDVQRGWNPSETTKAR